MIKDRIAEYLDAFKMRQDHLVDVMRDGYHATGGDVSASEDVISRIGPPPYIVVDDDEISYLVVDDKSCHRLEPFFEPSEECVNLEVNTHEALLVIGTGAVETMMVLLIPANPDYQFTFVNGQEIKALIDQRLIRCVQAYMDDMIEFIGPFTEEAIYRLMPSLNADIRKMAEKLDVSMETIMSHDLTRNQVLLLIVKIVYDWIFKAAVIYTGLVHDAYLKQACDTSGIAEDFEDEVINVEDIDVEEVDEDIDETLALGMLKDSLGSDIRINVDKSEWRKVEPLDEWPDGGVDSSLALVICVATKASLALIISSTEERIANSLMTLTRMIRNATEGSEMTEDELIQSSYMRVVITRNMRIQVGLATEESIKKYEEESIDEDDT